MSALFEVTAMAESQVSAHERAAAEFARRVGEQKGDAVSAVLLYGSVARGEERGTDSDVDILVILRDTANRTEEEDEIRDIAYDIELERGLVLSLILKTESEFERRKSHPFLRNVRHDAEVLHG
jgi:predicted nucleotidyltransferase